MIGKEVVNFAGNLQDTMYARIVHLLDMIMLLKRNRRNSGVKGPLKSQYLKGWNTSSEQPYAYLVIH